MSETDQLPMPAEFISEELKQELVDAGFTMVTEVNPPVHGSGKGFSGNGVFLSLHGGFVLFHYLGGNCRIQTPYQVRLLADFLDNFLDNQ